MARSQHKTTIAVLRDILGPIDGQENRFSQIAERSPSWVKKVSAGIVPLSMEAACVLEKKTGVSLQWLMGSPNAKAMDNYGQNYTRKTFEWHSTEMQAGKPRLRSTGFPFVSALAIAGIGSAAGDKGESGLFTRRLNAFLDDCAMEFGFDADAHALAEAELNQAPRLTRFYFHDPGFDPETFKDERISAAMIATAKAETRVDSVHPNVAFPTKRALS